MAVIDADAAAPVELTTFQQWACEEGVDEPYKSAQVLNHLYHGEELTTREIGDIFDCHNTTVKYWMDKHDIEARDNWSDSLEKMHEAARVHRAKFYTHQRGYEYWGYADLDADGENRTSRVVYIHRLVAVAENGLEAVKGNVIHHKNKIPWDNRPENLEVLSAEEHGSIHSDNQFASDGGASV